MSMVSLLCQDPILPDQALSDILHKEGLKFLYQIYLFEDIGPYMGLWFSRVCISILRFQHKYNKAI